MLRNLLGHDVVLLPVVHGQKRPMISGWQHKTSEDMQDADYLAALSNGNIGVLLGAPSGNLCAIDIDDDAAVEPFLELNPNLRNTLRSKGARGQQVWLRITGEYPDLSKLATSNDEQWGEWRAGGGQSVIYGVHPTGTNYQFIHEVPPIEVRFEDIVWPDNLELPWPDDAENALVALVGPPLERGERGTVKINQMFWVRRYMEEHTVVYDLSLGDFYEYDAETGLWEKQSEQAIKRRFLEELTDTAQRYDLQDLMYRINDGLASSLLELLRTLTAKNDVFSKRPVGIHVKNGMLCRDGNNFVLRDFSPDFYSRNMCPYEYDENARCLRFENELLGTALDADDIVLMQKWAGACLLGRNAAQRFLMLLGMPGGGKSTFMSVLEEVIGLMNVTQLRVDHLGKQFEHYNFVGKSLLAGKDVPSDFLLQKSATYLKALVGGDRITAEKKGHSEPLTLRGDFNVGITCNADLNVRLDGDNGAWKRRMMIVRYNKPPVARRIPDFGEKLLAEEGPGILRWMVQGAIQLLLDLDELGDYRLTQEQRHRVEFLLAQSDSVRHFVNTCVVADPDSSVPTATLKREYEDFCTESGWTPLPDNEVSRVLQEAMLDFHRVRPRNDIRNPNGNGTVRGYSKVAIRREARNEVQN